MYVLTGLVAALIGSAVGAPEVRRDEGPSACIDNCGRAVGDSRGGQEAIDARLADCVDFLASTITPELTCGFSTVDFTVTETVYVTAPGDSGEESLQKRDDGEQVIEPPAEKTIPAYASICSDTVRYSKACSCLGIEPTTVVAPPVVATTTMFTTVTVDPSEPDPRPTWNPCQDEEYDEPLCCGAGEEAMPGEIFGATMCSPVTPYAEEPAGFNGTVFVNFCKDASKTAVCCPDHNGINQQCKKYDGPGTAEEDEGEENEGDREDMDGDDDKDDSGTKDDSDVKEN
ncbi:hypothetical protein S40288_11518, partial [Stachybotrys chartarum IBT 40288]